MGGKRKRKLMAPTSLINKARRPLPNQYDFVSKATTSNLPQVVLPNNNPAPSVRDYPPLRQLFPCSTFPPSGSAPVPQTQPPTRVPQSSGGEGTSYPQPGRRQSQSPPLEESPSSPLHGAPSPHSSQAQNSHGDPEDFTEFEAPVEPDLSEDVMDVLNRMLSQPGREEWTTVLSPKLEPGRLFKLEHVKDNTVSSYIDCDNNSSGARFVHAIAETISVSDSSPTGWLSVPDFIRGFFPMNGVKNADGVSEPLLALQVAEMKDGVFISFGYNHLVVNGSSMWKFFTDWSKILLKRFYYFGHSTS
ncbi:hypothetical protein Bca52824_023203 [Brassica carinata]|uniref:Acetyltransferase n=1 Tax=Brassica carinata TaxID=52824 RepID=A0A8X7VIB7_BRACI|nr:hypothetical protein Bca52824_023203 [Brassica carinata]